jgi:hypothetical protein
LALGREAAKFLAAISLTARPGKRGPDWGQRSHHVGPTLVR